MSADTRYIRTLPEAEQDAIRVRLGHLTPEELATALDGRVSDIEES